MGVRVQHSAGKKQLAALAIGAHPDDIEFSMAGTLLLLKQSGFQIHCLTVATGSCGSIEHSAARLRVIRKRECLQAAKILGAQFHGSFTDDLEIFYNLPLLRKVSAVIRQVAPSLVLTHSPQDYMEDHMITSRLAVTAAFARGMPNFRTLPPRPAVEQPVALYHALPHGLRDPLRRRIIPGAFVDTTSVHQQKRTALAMHKSQKEWLDVSQGMDSYLLTLDEYSRAVGRMSGRFELAEGWRRHLHLGFAPNDSDPLQEILGKKYLVNHKYEQSLEKGI